MADKIAILGKLETKFLAPFKDHSWEIWSMNKHDDENQIPRVDVWFDFHKVRNDRAIFTRDNFPFQECYNLIGGEYFNNTTALLIAFAIIKGAKEIALFGSRFYSDNEKRRNELQNVQNMIFFAKGRGIKVTMPADEQYLLPTNHLYFL